MVKNFFLFGFIICAFFFTIACSERADSKEELLKWFDKDYMIKNHGWVPSNDDLIRETKRLQAFNYYNSSVDVYLIEMAVVRRDEMLVSKLIEGGSEVNPDGRGVALCQAIQADEKATVVALLKAGASPDAPGLDNGNVPLHYAVRGRQFWAIDLLIAYHANMHAKNASGETPKDVAKSIGDEGVVKKFAEEKGTVTIN
jgi:ankyrin repeat protein